MITWLKRLLNRKREREQREWDRYYAMCEKQHMEREERDALAKAEWEVRNEREKKVDACYLGTRNKAFYGTYEEWLSAQRQAQQQQCLPSFLQ